MVSFVKRGEAYPQLKKEENTAEGGECEESPEPYEAYRKEWGGIEKRVKKPGLHGMPLSEKLFTKDTLGASSAYLG